MITAREILPQMKLTKSLRQLENVLFDNILAQKGAGLVFKLSGSSYVPGSRDPSLSMQIKVVMKNANAKLTNARMENFE